MRAGGYVEFGMGALRGHRLRTGLSVLGIAIGVGAVILLTSIGEGTRRFMLAEFAQFGTNILEITPGKRETSGSHGIFAGTTHKLSLDDAEAVRRIPEVTAIVPLVAGKARVEGNGRGRGVFVYGVTSELPEVWKFQVGQGSFLPPGDPRRARSVVVLGPKLKRELFGDENALGRFVRAGGARLRVIGVMAPKGRMLGFDIDDSAYVPVATAMRMFNLDELHELDVLFTHESVTDEVSAAITRVLSARHDGREDFTITTQAEMLRVFDNVMRAITAAVGAIAGVSLAVGAIGTFAMMWITVGERVGEIGLLRSLGATRREIHAMFLLEAVILTGIGGVVGVVGGMGLATAAKLAIPGLPAHTPLVFVAAAIAVSGLVGLASGVLPARRAASLDPIDALRAE